MWSLGSDCCSSGKEGGFAGGSLQDHGTELALAYINAHDRRP